MIDWTSSMTQTYEYYIVNPDTWKDVRPVRTITGCSINRDSGAETLGSASISSTELLGECYIRVYMIVVQNGFKMKVPLGTFLLQTPASSFDGKVMTTTVDAYTPLIELKENQPPLGYALLEGTNVMEEVYRLTRENMRAPVVRATSDVTLYNDFVANLDETWITYLRDLMANAKYRFDLDELGRVIFAPKRETAAMQPVWTFDDDNSSILHPSISVNHDIYGIPNVVEVTYSGKYDTYTSKVVNDDPNSPVSTVNRGRVITHVETNPNFGGEPTKAQVDLYAKALLRELSTLEYKVDFSHAYCPVRVGDCVRLDYAKAGLDDVKARIISQAIKCEPGCTVSSTAVYTKKLWG